MATPKKKASGAQNRKAKREREGASGPATGEFAKLLDKVGPPPEPTTELSGRLRWAHQLASTMAWAVLRLRGVDLTRVRLAQQLIATMGMTYPRAELEELADKGDPKKKARQKASGATVPTPAGAWKKKGTRGAPPETPPDGGEGGPPPP